MKTITISALVGGGLVLGALAGAGITAATQEPEVRTEVKEVQVEVPVTSEDCLVALELAQDGIDFANTLVNIQSDMIADLEAMDFTNYEDYSLRLDALNSQPLDGAEYQAAREACLQQ